MNLSFVKDKSTSTDFVQKGLKDSKEGNVYTKEEAKLKLRKWLK